MESPGNLDEFKLLPILLEISDKMVQTINPFKDLGKCFFFPVKTKNGFLPTRLSEETKLTYLYGFDSLYSPTQHGRLSEFIENKKVDKKYPGRLFVIDIGKDYHGSLELPDRTELVEVFNLPDGNQVIYYYHHLVQKSKKVSKYRIIPFANEMRSKDSRLEVADLIPEETRTFDELVKAEPDFSSA